MGLLLLALCLLLQATTAAPFLSFRRRARSNQIDKNSPFRPSSSFSRGGAAMAGAPLLLSTAAKQSVSHYLRVALSGGIAGAVGTVILYPVDTAKTLRQSNPTRYASVRHALMDLIFSSSSSGSTTATSATATASLAETATEAAHHSITKLPRAIRIQKAYRGVLPATLGAIPSSALYFGAYETCKTLITREVMKRQSNAGGDSTNTKFRTRLFIHGLAAASGNVLSSAVFVPKEFWKQQLQMFGDSKSLLGVVSETLQAHGWRGMYAGYQATLLRNVPSAVLRFALYEELKWNWYQRRGDDSIKREGPRFSPILFAAGALSGAVASGCMTPMDVWKTRIATHTIPTAGFIDSARYIVQQDGIRGLYAGAGSRMVWSGAFSAIGFGTFEFAKSMLGVGEDVTAVEGPKQKKKR